MSSPIIRVENLGKSYMISQNGHTGYTAFRDVITQKARALLSGSMRAAKNQNTEEFWALKDVSFEIKEGEAIGIIGRNGAGKSTLLKILSRITDPTRGRITLEGRVASLLEVGTGFHPELSGRENIYLNGAILGMTRKEIKAKFDEIVDFSGVEKFLDTPVKRYSSGMYVRLAFAVAAHLEPEILVVDEVLAVGDMEFQKKCLGKMNDISQSGRTVIFVSHNMAAIESLCQQAILLKDGYVESIGKSRDITQMYLQNPLDSVNDENPSNQVFDLNSKKAQITRLEFLSDRNHTNIFYMGHDLEIRLHYRASVPLENPLLGIILYDAMGAPILFFNNKNYGVFFGKKMPGAGMISLKIDDLNLTPGFYSLDIHFGDAFEDIDVKKHCLKFQIVYKHFLNKGEALNEKLNRVFYKHVDWAIASKGE